MITTTMRQINDPTAAVSFNKLQSITSNSILSIKTKYDIAKIAEKLGKEAQRLDKIRTEILDQYLEKDDQGKPVFLTNDKGEVDRTRYKLKDGVQDEWKKRYEEWLDTKIEIPCKPIRVSEVLKVDFSSLELMSLEFMLTGFDELEGETESSELPAPLALKK